MDLAQVFLTPRNANHRHYEALRAYFVDQLPAAEVARRFGYTVGSFHQLAHQFRHAPQRTLGAIRFCRSYAAVLQGVAKALFSRTFQRRDL